MTGIERLYSMQNFDENGSLIVHHRPPYKEILLAVGLLTLGAAGIVIGMVMIYNKIGGDHLHDNVEKCPEGYKWVKTMLKQTAAQTVPICICIVFTILGGLLFLPGFYETRIAYYAYKGYKGFSFANIPAV